MRAVSLASRFLLTLVLSAVLPLLLYGWFSLRAMREQIDEQVVRVFLPQLAADYAQKIEAHLQRMDQSCELVREIARRALVSREELAAFARQIELVPDLLDNHLDLLLVADPTGRVVYWKDGQRLDPDAHCRRAALIPESVADSEWFQRVHEQQGKVHIAWGRSKYLHRGLDFRSMDPASYHLGLALEVPQPDGPPGVLFALLRWAEVQLVLDEARDVLTKTAKLPSARVMLVGRNGVVRGHTDRSRYGLTLEPTTLAETLKTTTELGRSSFRDPSGEPWRVGFAPAGQAPERSFVLGVTVPEAELFAESDRFEQVLLMAIAVTIGVLVFWSLVASRAIVAPVRALLAATRRIASGDLAVSVPARGGPELGELATAFNQMATELAAGRESLASAEREQAWAEMARQVAHEIKNPLQPMRLVAQMLQRARAEEDPRAEKIAERLAKTVLEQTAELDRIAGDFRAFGGVARAAMKKVAIDDWLQELRGRCAGLFAGRPLELTLEAGAPEVKVAIEGNALARVFVNLLQNATEAAPDGVHATMRSASVSAEGEVLVTIVDDGPGVPEDVRPRLFEPYFTTKSSGTGLGLAICRRLVESHGGGIRLVESRPGHTEFEIRLPILDEESAAGDLVEH
ncbi:MAG: sensor histidine kinase [bacterium]|nr:sensor histidine kinase [bacterium]